MSRLNLKTDFKDGDKLFGIELNNNFKVIEEGYDGTTKEYEDIVADVKARKWQGESNESVAYFKGTTSEVNARQTIKGQVLYDISTGETFLDVSDSVRINTGSGNVVSVSEEEPTNPSTKIWIKPSKMARYAASYVVDSMEGTDTDKAPSVNSVKEYVDGVILYDDETGSNTNITLNDTVENYDIIEIFGYRDLGTYKVPCYKKIYKPFNDLRISLVTSNFHTEIVPVTVGIYTITINDKVITKENQTTYNIDNNSYLTVRGDATSMYITKVIGYNKVTE